MVVKWGQCMSSSGVAPGPAPVRGPAPLLEVTTQSRLEADLASLRAGLRTRGYRLTAQRQLVLEAVGQLGHATPEQVLTVVQRKAVAVNASTVYRTLTLLEELGVVRHTHLGHGPSTFSLAAEQEHVHLVCRDCAAVQELPAERVGDLVARLARQQGFVVDIGHTALFGRCANCSPAAADPAPAWPVGLL